MWWHDDKRHKRNTRISCIVYLLINVTAWQGLIIDALNDKETIPFKQTKPNSYMHSSTLFTVLLHHNNNDASSLFSVVLKEFVSSIIDRRTVLLLLSWRFSFLLLLAVVTIHRAFKHSWRWSDPRSSGRSCSPLQWWGFLMVSAAQSLLWTWRWSRRTFRPPRNSLH